jgi:hypothetical protein
MLFPAMVAAVISFFSGLLGWELLIPFGPLRVVAEASTALMVSMNVALYMVVILVALALASNSITREKASNTWDMLLLTDVTARQIIRGKWWASLRALWGDHSMLLLLRLGLVGWLVSSAGSLLPPGMFGLPDGLAYVLPMALIVTAFTVVDAAFTAALGIAVPLTNMPRSIMVALTLSARAALVGASTGYFALVGHIFFENGGVDFIGVGLAGLLIYGLLTWAMLRLAEVIAVRAYVSPPAG